MIRYYVTDRRQGDIIAASTRAVRDGVEMIQVREKDLTTRELYSLVLRIRNIAGGSKTKILVNDRLDVALATGIDGVHLPAEGLPAERVRPFVKTLGISAHTLDEAFAAQSARADFIVFGPIFDTPGKKAVGLDPLRQVAAAVTIPVLAIGGVTLQTADQILRAGAAGIAGIRLFQSTS